MTAEASIVTQFGESVASDAMAVVELDELKNVDAAGEEKSQFSPGEDAWFLVHLDPGLYIDRIEASAGSVQVLASVSRTRRQQLQFNVAADTVQLPHNPSGSVQVSWYGRDGQLTQAGRVLSAAAAPAIGEAEYTMQAIQCRFIPPNMELGADEQHPILVVIHVEAA